MTNPIEGTRYGLLTRLIGKPWVANAKGPDAYDCFHLTQYVERTLFHRELADVELPNDLSWGKVFRLMETSPEFESWQEIITSPGVMGHVPDGAIVLMARGSFMAHLGVWFREERSVLHVDNPDGVRFDTLTSLNAMGWRKLKFFIPKL